ncbi:response regulator transcription factor [Aquimarina hainanensis]|uniref:Response regulator transcription factor n=1 Tax=Aquimarina hainanensis TaxID=1578017 RepID=A0ABW5N9E7_9FLAO|nr:response regulator transcription factor [Aquimarina sp. TRL1]QKX03640.1 response regulator transcription factor [Aquimarina sp. TRL1]
MTTVYKDKFQVLLAEDDSSFGMLMKSYLELHEYEVTLAPDGVQAITAITNKKFDLCILDVNMPRKDGFTLAEEIKKRYPGIPFIFLTAKALKEDQLRGYQIGADDYLIKPFDSELLLMKISIVIHRNNAIKQVTTPLLYTIGSFEFNYETRQLFLDKKTKKLTPTEAELLRLLCEYDARKQVLPREKTLLSIWKSDDYYTTRSMDVFITKLRGHLKEDPNFQIEIINIHNKGFRLEIQPKSKN